MQYSVKAPRLAWLAGLALVFTASSSLMAQQFPAPNVGAPVAPRLDVGKGKIEFPAKNLYAKHAELAQAVNAYNQQAFAQPTPTTSPENPRVEPGKVNWHPTFEAALEASRKSGKPVLLFQMMGKLDLKFC
jgi:hypothetical protein